MATRLIESRTKEDTAPAVRVHDLRRAFGDHVVLEHLDLTIAPGELVAVLGRSGSGKSTLLRTLAGLDPVQHGAVEVPGTVGVAFQEPRLLPWKRVADNVALALHERPRTERRERALAVLDEVGLADKQQVWPVTLSGGQAQRASLARALVSAPGLLLLDEPFSALDALTRLEMHDLVLSLWREHRPAVLLVTHDVDEALKLADRVLVIEGGQVRHETVVRRERPRDPGDLADERTALLQVLGVHEGVTRDQTASDQQLSDDHHDHQEKAS